MSEVKGLSVSSAPRLKPVDEVPADEMPIMDERHLAVLMEIAALPAWVFFGLLALAAAATGWYFSSGIASGAKWLSRAFLVVP